MTITNKDFVVKNGLIVNNGATFGQAVEVGTPTSNNHAATKSYVDGLISGAGSGVTISDTEPSSPSNGDFWFDINIQRLKIYYGEGWIVMASSTDAEYLPDHRHDTSIDGDGYIVDIIALDQDPNIVYIDGGDPFTTTFTSVLNGGGV